MIEAYREQDQGRGRELMVKLIDSISHGVPKPLTEVITLGRTLKKRAADVLAYFDRPGTSNGPTEAINGRLEHLRGSALGFRNLHQLHRPIPARDRRLQTSTTPSSVMRPIRICRGECVEWRARREIRSLVTMVTPAGDRSHQRRLAHS